MIRINFIPQEERKTHSGVFAGGFGPVPFEVVVGIVAGVSGILLCVHVLLAGLTIVQAGRYIVLQTRWSSMAADKKAYDDVAGEIKRHETRLGLLKPIVVQHGVVWARLMNDISDSIPKGAWIRELRFGTEGLAIYGSSVSRVKSEMMTAGSFVSDLKEKTAFQKVLTGVDVDSIQRRDVAGLSIADFTIKARAIADPVPAVKSSVKAKAKAKGK